MVPWLQPLERQLETTVMAEFSASTEDQDRGRKNREKERSLGGRIVSFSNKHFHHLDHIPPILVYLHSCFRGSHLILTNLEKYPLELFTTAFS